MDIKKIKLALTVELMNHPAPFHPVRLARAAMRNFEGESGNFRQWSVKHSRLLNEMTEQKTLELVFEHCTLNLDLVRNRASKTHSFHGFDLREN